MGQIAFVFSGQGDQYPGMGKNFYERYEASKAIFDRLDELRPGTTVTCFEGSEEELQRTDVTQPCLFTMELAAAAALEAQGVHADAVAGFSLGEIAAAAYSGLVSLEDGFRLVCRRGLLMQECAERFDTAMAAVLRLSPGAVEELCDVFTNIYPVNYNCPGQITVSGLASEMPAFTAAVKAAGGRTIPLKVSGAFHSPFMNEAAEQFEKVLQGVEMAEPRIPLYSNKTAKPYENHPVELMAAQIVSPVRWEETIRNMIDGGVDTFVEIGPGRTLTNMIRKIDGNVTAKAVTEYLEEATC